MHVHFIGIGGIGASSLARWFLAHGNSVSGSDAATSSLIRELQREGVLIQICHRAKNVPSKTDLVIWSQAIRTDNPERQAAERRGIASLSYPQMVGELTRKYRTIGLAGAHGKSTTTALAACVLIAAGLDPTVVVGTKLKELRGSNFRIGKSNWLVLEADEYKRAFWNYSPTVAVVNNIDREHLDCYKDIAEIRQAFLRFMNNVLPGGVLILNKDNHHLRALAPKITRLAKRHALRVHWYSRGNSQTARLRRTLRIPGEHNISNALGVLEVARAIGIPEETAFRAIGRYRGAWRRMELRGSWGGAPVFDDYGHHPTEVAATLQGFRDKFPNKKILCVFQPHQAERLAKLFKEFQTAFAAADETIILPEYTVAGRDTLNLRYSAAELVRVIQKKQPKKSLFYLANTYNLSKALATLGTEKKVIIMMGAGPIVELTDHLLASPPPVADSPATRIRRRKKMVA